jgi:hypothetical protein
LGAGVFFTGARATLFSGGPLAALLSSCCLSAIMPKTLDHELGAVTSGVCEADHHKGQEDEDVEEQGECELAVMSCSSSAPRPW